MINKILDNRYEIIEKIGGGGMAEVYKAKCHLLDRFVAIKILRSEFTKDDDYIMKFKRESQAAASLSHSNIVSIYDVGSDDNIHYIVMEYIKGKTLKEYIRENERLNPYDALDITIQIADALKHAHNNNIIHRDIKPQNIMITKDNTIRVMDFGIAKKATTKTLTATSNVTGSVHYISPEQARGGYTDAKSDIYALGIVMYEMVTGKVPFEGDSPITVALKHIRDEMLPPSKIVENLPYNIEKIILKATQKKQMMRYENTDEMLVDLRKAKIYKDDKVIHSKDYSDSPTLVIPAIKDDFEDANIKRKISNKDNEISSKRSKKIVTIFAIILSLFFTSASAVTIIKVKDYFNVQEVTVPDIIGLHRDDAEQMIKEQGLRFVIEDEKFDDKYNEGYVIYQSEKPNTKLKKDYPIKVYISKGKKLVTVPNLFYEDLSKAKILLNEKELILGEETEEFSDYPIGFIIRQTPKANEEVEVGTQIDYVISKGQEIKSINIPDLIGFKIEDAKKRIINLGLAVGEVKYEDNDKVGKDKVIWHSFKGEKVEEGEQIDFIVSKGTPIKTYEIKIDLSSYEKETVNVKIVKILNGKNETVYEKEHNNVDVFTKMYTVRKGAKFIVYIDDEFVREIN